MADVIKRSLTISAGVLVLVVIFGLIQARSPNQPQAMIFHNGVIRTLNGDEIVEALYMRDGQIMAVGTFEEVRANAPRVPLFDLEGGALTPGLIEPHTHPLANALLGAAINLSGPYAQGRDEVMARISSGLAQGGPSPWAIGFGWDPILLDGAPPPSLEELDTLSPDRPLVVLTQMMHEAFANSAALHAAGITRDTPDPHDGYFERDASGELTGRVVEVSAVGQLMAGIPAPSDAALRFLLAESYAQYARAGYTTIGITGIVGRARDPLAILQDIAGHDRTALNTALYLLPDQFDQGADLFEDTDQVHAIRIVSGMKIWLDGSPFVGGAATAEPYADTRFNADVLGLPPGWRGPLAIPDNTALALARQTHGQGLQMAFHAQGETAIDLALTVIETVQAEQPHPYLHHRLEHLALITPDQMDQAIALDMTLGFFPDHIGYYGHRLAHMFGTERAGRYMPIELARQRGAVVTIHGDHPASTVDSARVMALPVHRRTPDGQRLGDQVDAEFALSMMTLNAARQLQLDHQIGSLEPGKRADLVWFDTDPVLALETGVPFTARQTWLAGRPVDTRPGSLDRIGRMLAAAWGQITN